MAKTKARISRNRDFLGVAPLQTHTHTDRQRTDRPGSPPPRAGNLHPVGGLSPPHSNELLRPLAKGAYFGSIFFFFCACNNPLDDVVAGAGKKWYFIIFSLRICLGCARHGPCLVGPTGPGPGVPPFRTQNWQEVPKCSKRLFEL